ncbi:MAG: hypothetical protein ACHQM6_10040 [Candidatus Kapaibacterium sp.]
MKTSQHIRILFPSLLLVAALLTSSCKQVTQAISNLLTFDINKSANFPVSHLTPTGILTPNFGIPIPLDSATLAQQKTSLSLIRTIKLTKLVFTPDDPFFDMSNFDTISLAVGLDSLNTIWLGSWSGSGNKVILTNNDFAADAKNSKDKFFARFKLKNDPAHDITIKTDFTFSISADPLN